MELSSQSPMMVEHLPVLLPLQKLRPKTLVPWMPWREVQDQSRQCACVFFLPTCSVDVHADRNMMHNPYLLEERIKLFILTSPICTAKIFLPNCLST
jgi:hypothetical protein